MLKKIHKGVAAIFFTFFLSLFPSNYFTMGDNICLAQANWLGSASDKSTPKVNEFVQAENHRIMFFLGPGLAGELAEDELGRRLSQYVEDLNVIFGKQTNRHFGFDPETDITITSIPPPMGYYVGRLPEKGYEIWIHAVLTDNPAYGSNGGGAYFGRNGAGVACKLKWDAVHDPSRLIDGSEELEQYWRQIDHITHEIEHIFGAGIGEYYRLSVVGDTTGYEPIKNIRKRASDPYWSKHQDYFADPLFNNIWNSDLVGNPTSREDLLDRVSFADVTVGVVNRGPRNADSMLATLPDLTCAKVKVIDKQSGLPLPNVLVMVWNVNSISPYSNEVIAQGSTDVSGELEFSWAPYLGTGVFGNDFHFKLIKSYLEGYEPEAKWVSIYDCQEEKVVHGMDQMVIQVALSEESEHTY
jgi:hypothetical protein